MNKSEKQLKILSIDPWLNGHVSDLRLRTDKFTSVRQTLLGEHTDLSSFANGYMYFGFHKTDTGWVYREWAPAAEKMHLIGDFNFWNRTASPMKRISDNGIWEIKFDGHDALKHGQHVKVCVTHGGRSFDRIPLYIKYAVQDKSTGNYDGVIWEPDVPFKWTDGGYGKRKVYPLTIYEAHIGISREDGGVGTYDYFTDCILPRIKKTGYNAVQLMAIMEHPYYASFGYQVSNFFAPCSRFGTPDGLKRLINTAHEMGLIVLLDLVHSHMCPNTNEGPCEFDGTRTQFCPAGERGTHSAWGTRLFDYGKHDVIHFLLSNIKYWLEEYHFDGFRFDGVTSMLYHDHGLGSSFDNYDKYFSMNTNIEAVTYLQLATELIHTVNPLAVAIAEDMSGMPGMCLSIRYGGIGFDYRLAMGIPDFWIRTIKERPADGWDMNEMWHELTTRRPQEKSIGYAQCHDQALVGDKTLIFRLADAEMYTGMDINYHSYGIDRAVALDKLMRFATLTLGCDGYLNFMGNEFGHPEWIDFPREGNGFSGHYARRQWSLGDNPNLKYNGLLNFDIAMHAFARKYRVLCKKEVHCRLIDNQRKLIVFEKGELLYIFCFGLYDAWGFELNCPAAAKYVTVFNSLGARFAENEFYRAEYNTVPINQNECMLKLDVRRLSCVVLSPA